MSYALFESAGYRFHTQKELIFRDQAIITIQTSLENMMRNINNAWRYERVECPIITPSSIINSNYTESDVWFLKDEGLVLRPETTPSSYAIAKHLLKDKYNPPLCVWQYGKSYRKELSDGATANKLRFQEFNQLEFQHIYTKTTKKDYMNDVIFLVEQLIKNITNRPTRYVSSERLPSYSLETNDVEVFTNYNQRWTEMCSISLRNDFHSDYLVLEVAIGLDRLIAAHFDNI